MKKRCIVIILFLSLLLMIGAVSCKSNSASSYASSMVYAKVEKINDTFLNVKILESSFQNKPNGGEVTPPNDGTTPPEVPNEGTTPPDAPNDGTTPPDVPNDGTTPPEVPNGGDKDFSKDFKETSISLKIDLAGSEILKNNESININEISVDDIILIYFDESGNPNRVIIINNN